MIALDTSAIVAFLRNEPEAQRIQEILAVTPRCYISAVNVLECRTVLWGRFGAEAVAELEDFLALIGVSIEPFDEMQAQMAFAAYRRFGKGSGHAAQLNLGDCAAYALATSRNLPLLFKGTDFARTDVIPCL